jgi:DNA-3-methyladenine glycosylase I
MIGEINMHRCDWVTSTLLQHYHDEEWGVPAHDDCKHFEMLILEGAQAGLSWETVLRKRDAYREVFKGFNPEKVAQMNDAELDEHLQNSAIIRNRLKVFGTRKNALAFLGIQQEFGSFDRYIWQWVDGKPLDGRRESTEEVPTATDISTALSKDLKKRGMTFVGPTTIYAYMQAVGLVNDHLVSCFRYPEVEKMS